MPGKLLEFVSEKGHKPLVRPNDGSEFLPFSLAFKTDVKQTFLMVIVFA